MEDKSLLELWKSYDQRLDAALTLNRNNAMAITRLQLRSFLSSMQPGKWFAVIVGVCWIIGVDVLLYYSFRYAWPDINPFFTGSALLQVIITKIAVGVYIYQLHAIHTMPVNDPILQVQQRLIRLQWSTLWVTRILILQLPLWTTFFWSKRLFASASPVLVALPIGITLLFTVAAVWLFRNIRYENRDQRWFRILFSGKEWTPLLQSAALLEDAKQYEQTN
jgi:hypothetical protein